MSDAPPDSKPDPAPKDAEVPEEVGDESDDQFTQNPDRIAAATTDDTAASSALAEAKAALAEAMAALAETKAALEEKGRQIYELNEQKNEITDLARRMRADMANMRRRRETEKANLQLRMVEHICKDFLPLLDDLQRAAAEAAPAGEGASTPEGAETGKNADADEALRTGVRLVARRFEESLKKQGFVEIEALGRPFDPRHHDAVHRVPADDGQEDGEIVEVFRRGYFLGDRVIRPASVVVAYLADPVAPPPAPAAPSPVPAAPSAADDETAPAEESGTETETPSGKEPSGD